MIFSDYLFTGDGIATALNVLRVMAETGRELADLAAELVTYPQVLVNVACARRRICTTVPADRGGDGARRGAPRRPGPAAGALLRHRAAAARDDRRARTSARSRRGPRRSPTPSRNTWDERRSSHAAAQRQRQQGRDAAQLARRRRAERPRGRRASASPPAHPASPCTRAPTRGTSRTADVREIAARAGVAARHRRVQHRRRSAAGPARAGRTRSGPISARSCRSSPARSPARPAGRRTRRPTSCGRSFGACRTTGSASACSSIRSRRPSRGPRRWAPTASSSTPSRSRARSQRGRCGAAKLRSVYVDAAELAHELGLGVNAGHDLDLANLTLFRTLPHLDEVSIGHALDQPRALRRPRSVRARLPGGARGVTLPSHRRDDARHSLRCVLLVALANVSPRRSVSPSAPMTACILAATWYEPPASRPGGHPGPHAAPVPRDFDALASRLASEGIGALALDLRGHGDSQGSIGAGLRADGRGRQGCAALPRRVAATSPARIGIARRVARREPGGARGGRRSGRRQPGPALAVARLPRAPDRDGDAEVRRPAGADGGRATTTRMPSRSAHDLEKGDPRPRDSAA